MAQNIKKERCIKPLSFKSPYSVAIKRKSQANLQNLYECDWVIAKQVVLYVKKKAFPSESLPDTNH